jgi:hypothetical protein
LTPGAASGRLDPWDDADTIARRLQVMGAELLVVIGAEAWCSKCARLRPLFDAAQAAQPAAHGVWMWLDLEDHAEFLGGFVPDDLPLLLRWRDGVCVQAALVLDVDAEADAATMAQGLLPRSLAIPTDVPDLWAGFARGDWSAV